MTHHLRMFEKKRRRNVIIGWIVNITVVVILTIFGTAYVAGVLHL